MMLVILSMYFTVLDALLQYFTRVVQHLPTRFGVSGRLLIELQVTLRSTLSSPVSSCRTLERASFTSHHTKTRSDELDSSF